jgi:hypothetical protein
MKTVLHAVTVIQPRFLLVNTGLEFLVVVLGVYLAWQTKTTLKVIVSSLGLGFFSMSILFLSIPFIGTYVSVHDNVQRIYRFSLLVHRTVPSASGSWIAGKLRCEVVQGSLSWLDEGKTTLRLLENNPFPGERAVAGCFIEPKDSGEYRVVVGDSYPHGGLPDRIVLRVSTDEKILLRHDMGDKPYTGDMTVSLGNLSSGENREVVVELLAVNPDPGAFWGSAAPVTMKVTMMPNEDPPDRSSRLVPEAFVTRTQMAMFILRTLRTAPRTRRSTSSSPITNDSMAPFAIQAFEKTGASPVISSPNVGPMGSYGPGSKRMSSSICSGK